MFNTKKGVKAMMTLDDYREELKNDIFKAANESRGSGKSLEEFEDDCWIDDSVTGNASGSYTFNAFKAQENISDLIWNDELLEMFNEFGYERIPLEKGAEFIDVSIRCFLLSEVIAENEKEIKEILGSC